MYYFTEPYLSIIQQMELALQEPEFFILLTGIEGSGKSQLLRQVMQRYQEAGFGVALIESAPESASKLRSAVRKAFNVEKTYNFARELEERLSNAATDARGIVLMFDNCDKMDDATLQELGRLADIQIKPNKMLSVIMCGAQQLESRLASSAELREVRQRISLRLKLPPLNTRTLSTFACLHARHTSKPDLIFDPSGLKELLKVSGGLPGSVIDICNKVADNHQQRYKTAAACKDDVIKVLNGSELSWSDRRKTGYTPKAIFAGTAVVATASVTALWFATQQPPAEVSVAELLIEQDAGANDELFIEAASTVPDSRLQASEIISTADAMQADAESELDLTSATKSIAATDSVYFSVEHELPTEPAAVSEIESVLEAEPVASSAPELAPELAPQITQLAETTVQRWADAWQNRDMESYFAHYHTDFNPPGFANISAWRANRIRNIRDRDQISLTISDWQVMAESDESVIVRFMLDYRSAIYSDRTLKELTLSTATEAGASLRILEEINLQVTRL